MSSPVTETHAHYPSPIPLPVGSTETRSSDSPWLPEQLPSSRDVVAGRWLLEAPVGRGGQGVVYRALDLETQQRCAVKLTRRSRRRNVAPILSGIRHPRIQELLGWGSAGGTDYLVFRLYRGSDLRSVVSRGGPLGSARVKALGSQLFATLSHLHKSGVVHRDVKPSNLLLDQRRLVLIDFDLAAWIGDPESRGCLTGTPHYMSRERLAGQAAGPADDVFAGAVSLFEIASGALPTAPAEPKNIGELRVARETPPQAAGALASFFQRALSPDPSQRFESALSAAVALSRAVA